MIEADALSDHVAIMDNGKIIAFGTLEELKRGSDNENILEFSFFSREEKMHATNKLKEIDDVKEINDMGNNKLAIAFTGGIKTFKQKILNWLDSFKSLHFREDSLEDIFLKLTGRGLRDN